MTGELRFQYNRAPELSSIITTEEKPYAQMYAWQCLVRRRMSGPLVVVVLLGRGTPCADYALVARHDWRSGESVRPDDVCRGTAAIELFVMR